MHDVASQGSAEPELLRVRGTETQQLIQGNRDGLVEASAALKVLQYGIAVPSDLVPADPLYDTEAYLKDYHGRVLDALDRGDLIPDT